MKLDPVTLDSIARKLVAASEETYLAIQRTAQSSFVNEIADFAVAILDPSGEVSAYPPSANFSFLIDTNFRTAIAAVPDLGPGDVIITNDPYTSGGLSTHLPDVHLIRPYFHEGKLVAYGWCFAHVLDIGGMVNGSVSAACTEIWQEGLRIPPVKLVEGGRINPLLIELIRLNTRVPDITIADLHAMLGALAKGEERVKDIAGRYGTEAVVQAQGDIQDYAAARAREVLRRIPDGAYDFWDYMDDDVLSDIPLRIRVKLTASDGLVTLDLTGTDPESESSYNTPTLGKRMYWLTFRFAGILTSHDPGIPRNAGLFRHFSITHQPGSILDAQAPAAVGLRSSPPYRLFDAVTGAVITAAPELIGTATGGAMVAFQYAEIRADGSLQVEIVEPVRSGMGALKGRDGADVRDNSLNNMRNRPIELVEAEQGLRMIEYDIRPDSGGAGEWRGGVGQRLVVEVTSPGGGEIVVSGMERARFAPWGQDGGHPGALIRAIVNAGRPDERAIAKSEPQRLQKGDTVTIEMPGGGGVGRPEDRPAERVAQDVREGFVSREAAERLYGVVLEEDCSVDAAATSARRAGAKEAQTGFTFGAQRDAWEALFDDATMARLNGALYALPRRERVAARRRAIYAAVPGLEGSKGAPLDTIMAGNSDAARARLEAAIAELSALAGT
ncbi:hydantoinase B/oxoprolinase family protein [Pseudoroseicyclus sp. CXY001]|uniref:hydantoinase B/oxoprolinase family protein n=1 Tax=Pseudoroseicyclus sp. CXY001 TaxID=3242492 RepID=UPI00357162C2